MAGKIVDEQEKNVEQKKPGRERNPAAASIPAPTSPSEPNMIEVEGLPSRCLFYPSGTIIRARPLKVIEVKKLSTLNETNAEHVINDVIRRATTGIAVEDLLVADKLYIVFWLRSNTYNEAGYNVDFHCNKCQQDSSYEFSLDNLEVKYVPENFNMEKLQISLPNGKEVEWSHPRVKDERKKAKFRASFAALIPDLDEDILSQAVNIQTIDGEDLPLIDKYNWIAELDAKTYSKLITEMEENDCGIKPILNVVCKKCGGTAPVAVTFQDEFFLPRYKTSTDS